MGAFTVGGGGLPRWVRGSGGLHDVRGATYKVGEIIQLYLELVIHRQYYNNY